MSEKSSVSSKNLMQPLEILLHHDMVRDNSGLINSFRFPF